MKNILNFMYKNIFKRDNLLLFFFLLSSFLSRLNSQFYFIDLLGHLGFQIIIGGILLSFFFLILKRLLASTICILICVLLTIDILSSCNHCNAFLEDKSQNYNKIRLITYNTGLSNDFKNLRELILFEKPDIVHLQEVSLQMQDELKSLESLFPYNTGLDKPFDLFSSIILSKYPLIKSNKNFDNYTVLTKVILDETELTIIGIHLSPPLNQLLLNLYVDMYANYTNTTRPQTLPLVNLDIAIKQMEYLKTLVDNTNQNLILMGD